MSVSTAAGSTVHIVLERLSLWLHRRKRLVTVTVLVIAIGELGAVALSSYARATHERVEINVSAGFMVVRVYLNCQLVRGDEGRIADVVDLGWLRPEDVVSIELTSTQTSGYFRISRRLNHGRWQTLTQRGSLGHAADFPHQTPVVNTAFLAAGTSLDVMDADGTHGVAPSCGAESPLWLFGPPLGVDLGTTPGRPNVAYDVASNVASALPWMLGMVGAIALCFAFVVGGKQSNWSRALTATLAVTQLVLAVLLSLGTVDVPVALAVCVVAGVVSIAIFLIWLHRDELAEPEQ